MDMDARIDTRGYLRRDPAWHSRLDEVVEVSEVLAHTRDYIATLTTKQLQLLPPPLQQLRVKGEDDLEYWTCKLSACFPSQDPAQVALVQDLFMHFLHASMRICQLHRDQAQRAESGEEPDGL